MLMWIKTQSGVLLNAERVVLFEQGSRALPGAAPQDAGYADSLTWTVRAVLEGDEVVLASVLPQVVADALMERLWSGVRYAKYLSVPAELAAIQDLKGGAA